MTAAAAGRTSKAMTANESAAWVQLIVAVPPGLARVSAAELPALVLVLASLLYRWVVPPVAVSPPDPVAMNAATRPPAVVPVTPTLPEVTDAPDELAGNSVLSPPDPVTEMDPPVRTSGGEDTLTDTVKAEPVGGLASRNTLMNPVLVAALVSRPLAIVVDCPADSAVIAMPL